MSAESQVAARPAAPTGVVAAPTAAPQGQAQGQSAADVFRRACEHEQAGRFDEAERLANQLLAALPGQADTLHLMGVIAFRRGNVDQALQLMEQSITNGLQGARCWRNICEVYRAAGRIDSALEAGKKAVELDPKDPHAHVNLAIVHYDRLETDEAIARAREAIVIDPGLANAHFELAELLLVRGEFDEGWEEYEWRYQISTAPPLMPPSDKPQWDGRRMDDEILMLVADQGFGDVIQFMRYIPWVEERVKNIHVACAHEIRPIVQQITRATLFDNWANKPDFACYCPLSGLPRLAGTRGDNVPAAIPYVAADPAKAAYWKTRLDTLSPPHWRRVGIAWAGRPTHGNDRNRSMRLNMLSQFGALERTTFVSVQKGPAVPQAGSWWSRAPFLNVGPELDNFGDTAAVIANLDMMVCVDTSVGHLAAAMGKPVWVMLPFASDWRWLMKRPDTAWYPNMRLFRQPRPRAWEPVIGAVAEALRRSE